MATPGLAGGRPMRSSAASAEGGLAGDRRGTERWPAPSQILHLVWTREASALLGSGFNVRPAQLRRVRNVAAVRGEAR